jgi:hypothetical protein
MSAAEGEAWGLNQAIDWLISLDLNWVIIEMDCKQVVDDVHNIKSDLSENGSIILLCWDLLYL